MWLLTEEDVYRLEQVGREVVKLTSWLTDKEVAHNVFITRFVVVVERNLGTDLQIW